MMETLEDRTLFSYPGFWQVTAPSSPITKITGPSLNAQGNDVSMDTIQLNGQRLTLSSNPDPNP
jgi:hypothetical protein